MRGIDLKIKNSETRRGKFTSQVFARHYILATGDSFEVGGATSYHLSEEDAEKFLNSKRRPRYYSPASGIEEVFVTPYTRRKIRESEGRFLLDTWEN